MSEKLEELLNELTEISEPNEKLKFLLSLGDDLPEFPESAKMPQHKISGCASAAYLITECKGGKMSFRGDSDAQIPKGILALFIFGLEGATPEEVLQVSPEIFEKTGLRNILSPSRANGAYQIFRMVQEEARKCKMQNPEGRPSA